MGDDVAKAEFLLAYGDFVRRVVAGKLATMSAHAPVRQDVEDIANDVLVRLLDNECSLLAQVRDRGRITAWLSRVARNFTVDYVRKWNNRMKAQGLAVREAEATFAPGPDAAVAREELLAAAKALMAGLAPRERLVLELYYAHGMPYAEIARSDRAEYQHGGHAAAPGAAAPAGGGRRDAGGGAPWRMMPGEEALREQLEQFVLGQLSPTLRATLEARIAAEPAVAAISDEVRAGVVALRAAMQAGQCIETTSDEDDVLIADFLDGALPDDALAAMEARLSKGTGLAGACSSTFSRGAGGVGSGQWPGARGEILGREETPFVKREPPATGEIPSTYAELAQAVEERKRRYLQFGN